MEKNIYLLPTDKQSRLHFDSELFVSPNYQLSNTINSIVEGRNMYITNDENPKDGDWVYYENGPSLKGIHKIVNGARPKTMILKKIVATIDKDLIDDGIQTIDDDFLLCFINNKNLKIIETIEIEIPKGFMNIGISNCNHFIADTNDSANWDTIKFPLPKGKWTIQNVKGKIVTLYKN